MSYLTEAEVDEELRRIPIVPLMWDKGKTGWKGVCLHRNTHYEAKLYGVGANQSLKIGRSKRASDAKRLALEWSKAMVKGNPKQRMYYVMAYRESMSKFPDQLEEEEQVSVGEGSEEQEKRKEGVQEEEQDREQLQQKVKELQQQVKDLREEIKHLQAAKEQRLDPDSNVMDEDPEEATLNGVEMDEVDKEGKEEDFLSSICAVVNKMLLSGGSSNKNGYHLLKDGITSIPTVMEIKGKMCTWNTIATSASADEDGLKTCKLKRAFETNLLKNMNHMLHAYSLQVH